MSKRRVKKHKVESCCRIAPPQGALRDAKHTWHFDYWDLYLRWQVIATSSTITLFPNHRLLYEQTVKLHGTQPQFGGVRWWFLCPDCQRRVLYLYLPQNVYHPACRSCENAYRFSCRRCHNLSYESTQSSHSASERRFQGLAREMGITTREARLWSHLTDSDAAVTDTKRPRLNKVRKRRTAMGRIIAKLAREKRLTI